MTMILTFARDDKPGPDYCKLFRKSKGFISVREEKVEM
jgi:hypothetical protein